MAFPAVILGRRSSRDLAVRFRVLCLKKQENDEDKLRRLYDAAAYGVRYLMYQNRVNGFLIARPEDLIASDPPDWGECR